MLLSPERSDEGSIDQITGGNSCFDSPVASNAIGKPDHPAGNFKQISVV
jgi:hypothetical protein